MNKIKFELSRPTYKIVPTFETIGRGKSKKNVLVRINCSIIFHKCLIIKSVITKNDIDKISQLEKFGVDFYSTLVNTYISELIIQINEMFDMQLIHKDFEDFYEKYQYVFIDFINELKTVINENIEE